MRIRAFHLFTVGLVLAAVTAGAQETPSGTVAISSKPVALGIGVSWGDGTLTYKGKKYPFAFNGLSAVDLGASKVSAAGEVYNLEKVGDFSGHYTATEAGATVGGGKSVTAMKNQNGVVMHLTATGQGGQFTLAPKGVEVALKK